MAIKPESIKTLGDGVVGAGPFVYSLIVYIVLATGCMFQLKLTFNLQLTVIFYDFLQIYLRHR